MALGVVGAVGVVLSLYYYLLLIRTLYVKPPPGGPEAERVPVPAGAYAVVVVGILSLVGLGVFWGPLYSAAEQAARALLAAHG